MAEDVITLLDYVGWTEDRGVHVVGTSLGGMIAMGAYSRPFDHFTESGLSSLRDGNSHRKSLGFFNFVRHDRWRATLDKSAAGEPSSRL